MFSLCMCDFHPMSKNMHVGLIDDSKVSPGVSVGIENGWMVKNQLSSLLSKSIDYKTNHATRYFFSVPVLICETELHFTSKSLL